MNDLSLLQRILLSPLETVAVFYASCLSANARAAEFVKEELSLDEQAASEKQIGFADRTLGKQIPHRRIKQGREVRDLLLSIGLYKANGRETMRGRVTEPIIDNEGNVIGLRGYKIDPHAEGEAIIVVGDDKSIQSSVDSCQEEKTVAALSVSPTTDDCQLITDDSSLTFIRDDRRYRIRGLEKNNSTCTLKVSMMVSRDGLVHLDSLDLVKARSRASFIKATATELYVDADIIKKDIGTLLLKLETLQAERIAGLKTTTRVDVKLTDAEHSEAMDLLTDPNLLERIASDIDACGYVGEATNKLAGYLAATSRKLDKPLAIVIQSSSSAGKTSLMDAVLSMIPNEEQMRVSKLTGQSLYYLETEDIQHKVLAISEDEGVKEATYALKLLQSEGCLRHAAVGKGESGKMTTQQRMYEFVGDLVKQQDLPRSAIRFTRRDLRESIGWSDFQIHTHLSRLVQFEYVIVHRGRQGRRFVYELLYDGKGREGQPFLSGLIDPAKLQQPAPMTESLSTR